MKSAKAKATQAKNKQEDYAKLKNFCIAKKIINRVKRLWNGKKQLEIIYLIMNQFPKYIRNSYNLIAEKSNNPIEK